MSAPSKEPAASLAGSHGLSKMDRSVPLEPTVYTGGTIAGKFLIEKKTYPAAGITVSCFSFAGWEPDEIKVMAVKIRKAADSFPGAFIGGALSFPFSTDERLEFWRVAGFSEADAQILTDVKNV